MEKKRRAWAGRLGAAAVVLLAAGGVLLLWRTGFFQAADSLEGMRAYIARAAPFAHLAFWLVQLLSVVLAPIPSNLTALAGAALFGAWPAFLLTVAAVLPGSLAVFFLARLWGAPFVRRLAGGKAVGRYLELLRRKRDVFLFLAFLFPLFPDDLLCILAGLTDLRPGRFFLLAALGRPWGLLVSCLIGGGAAALPLWAMALLAAAGAACFAVCLRYGDRWEARILERLKK